MGKRKGEGLKVPVFKEDAATLSMAATIFYVSREILIDAIVSGVAADPETMADFLNKTYKNVDNSKFDDMDDESKNVIKFAISDIVKSFHQRLEEGLAEKADTSNVDTGNGHETTGADLN